MEDSNDVISSIANIAAIEKEKAKIVKSLGEIKAGISDVAKSLMVMYKKLKDSETFKQLVDVTKRYNDEVKRATELSGAYKQQLEANEKLERDLTEAKRKAAEAEVNLARERRGAAEATTAFTGAVKSYTSVASAGNVSMEKSMELLGRYGVSLGSVAFQLKREMLQMKQLKDEMKQLEQERKKGAVEADEYKKRLVDLQREEGNLKAAISDTRINLNQLQKVSIQAKDSDKERGILLGQLRDIYRGLSQEEKQSASGKELQAYIQDLDVVVKQADASIGNFQRNVGHYQLAMEGIKETLEGLKEKASVTSAEIKKMEETMSSGSAAYEQEKKQLDEISAAMKRMEQEGGAYTAQYVELEKQRKKVLKDNEPIKAQYNEIAAAIKRLKEEGGAYTAQYAALLAQEQKGKKTKDDIKAQLDEVTAAMKRLREEGNDGTAQYAALAKQQDKLINDNADAAAQYDDVLSAMKRLREEGGAYTAQFMDLANQQKKLVKDHEAAKAQYNEITAAIKRTREEGGAYTAQYAALLKQEQKVIKDNEVLTAQYEKISAAMKRMEQDSSAYTAQYAALKSEMGEANQTLAKMQEENEASKKAYDDLMNSISATNEQIADYSKQMAEAAKDVEPMRTRLKELKQEAQELYNAMKDGTATEEMVERFNEVVKEAAKLQDNISDVSRRINKMASDTAVLDAISDGVKGVVGTFQVWKGAVAALGVDTEQFEAVMMKLQGAQSVVNGLTEISNMLKAESALRTKIDTLATSNNVVVKWLATKAQVALNAAVKASPYIIAAAALAALVMMIVKFVRSSSEAARQQKIINDIQKESVKLAQEEAKSITTLIATAKLHAVGSKERADAIKKINEQYGDYLPQLLTESSTVEELSEAYTRINEALLQQATIKAAMGELEKQAQQRIELAKEEAVELEKVAKIEERNRSLREQGWIIGDDDKNKSWIKAKKKLAEVQEENAEKEAKIARDEAAIMGVAQKSMQNLIDLRQRDGDAIKQQEAHEKEMLNLTRRVADVRLATLKGEEQRQQKQLEVNKNRAVEDLNTQKEALDKEVTNRADNAEKIAKIDELIAATHAKYAKDSADLSKKFAHEEAVAIINARITIARAGSEEELQARKDLIDEQLRYELSLLPEEHARRQELEVKAAQDVEALDRAAADRRRDIAMEELDIRLKYVQKGSAEELSLTMDKLKLEEEAELAAAEKTGASVNDIKLKWAKATAEASFEWTKSTTDDATRLRLEWMEKRSREETAAWARDYEEGNITYEQYQQEKERVAGKYAQAALKTQVDALKSLAGSEYITDEQRRETLEKLADFEGQLADDTLAKQEANMQKRAELEKKLADQQKQLVQEVAKLGLQLMEQIYAGRIKSIEKEKEAETERYDEEIRNIEDAGYSTEEEEARKRAAAAQTEIAQKQIDARLKEEKKKQAIANKVAAMTQAAISTALAIMNIWATVPKMDFGISTAALTATAIAIGLVQQAAILAQPLPEYGSGRAGGKAEWAITGDAGRSEVIVGRDGRATLTPSKPTLTYLHEGDKVIPSYEEYIRMTLPDIIPDYVKHPDRALTAPSVSVNISEMVEEQKRSTQRIEQAIKQQAEVNVKRVYGITKTVMLTESSTRTVVNIMRRTK